MSAVNRFSSNSLHGSFKGRGRQYLTLLRCPLDGAALVGEGGVVRCTADADHTYNIDGGVLRLFPPDQAALVNQASRACEERGVGQGWQTPDEAAFKSLPQTALSGYPDDYWPQQAAATALLWRFLEAIRLASGGLPVGPMGEAAVLGAGMGWLAYGLDVAGYTTLAVDACAGERYGLGVYSIARYMRVQALPTDPPLAPEAFDWVIFQNGLGSEPQTVLERGLHAVRPGGWLAVIDALAPDDAQYTEMHMLFEQTGLELVAAPQRRGWRARLLQLRDLLAGQDSGAPPVLVAQKPG